MSKYIVYYSMYGREGTPQDSYLIPWHIGSVLCEAFSALRLSIAIDNGNFNRLFNLEDSTSIILAHFLLRVINRTIVSDFY